MNPLLFSHKISFSDGLPVEFKERFQIQHRLLSCNDIDFPLNSSLVPALKVVSKSKLVEEQFFISALKKDLSIMEKRELISESLTKKMLEISSKIEGMDFWGVPRITDTSLFADIEFMSIQFCLFLSERSLNELISTKAGKIAVQILLLFFNPLGSVLRNSDFLQQIKNDIAKKMDFNENEGVVSWDMIESFYSHSAPEKKALLGCVVNEAISDSRPNGDGGFEDEEKELRLRWLLEEIKQSHKTNQLLDGLKIGINNRKIALEYLGKELDDIPIEKTEPLFVEKVRNNLKDGVFSHVSFLLESSKGGDLINNSWQELIDINETKLPIVTCSLEMLMVEILDEWGCESGEIPYFSFDTTLFGYEEIQNLLSSVSTLGEWTRV